jgi:hypothetical protein
LQRAEWIAELAPDYEAEVVALDGAIVRVVVTLRRADGVVANYRLTIDASKSTVSVRECRPEQLPQFCPERHINHDGSFCITWQPGAPLKVTTPEEAGAWWASLLGFLWLQQRASRLRRWPGDVAWAHGDAAIAQRDAERAANALGPRYVKALARRRLSVTKKRGPSGDFLELRDQGRWLYAVWEKAARVATLGQACLCGNKRAQLRACGDHARAAADLVFALELWRIEEKRFWHQQRGRTCCGTMDDCPMANQAKVA